MSLSRREFASVLAAAMAAGFPMGRNAGAQPAEALYDIPRFGNVHLLHMTDCHAQLLPVHYREPAANIGVGALRGKLPHLVGEQMLKAAGLRAGSARAHAFTYLDFERAARRYGRVGGFAHLATLVKRLRASRPDSLLLDGGDTLQGSATALWTQGQDMVEAIKLLGVDLMTGHWEFTYGEARVQQVVEKELAGTTEFLAQNVRTQDFGDPVFKPYVLRKMNGAVVAVIGQAFPYTPIANPSWQMPSWSFGIREKELQETVDEARAKGAQAVVLLSHNGMDVDLKLAGRVRGIDAILGGHTHDGVPLPLIVPNAGGQTIVTNAGSNGKFLGVLDLQILGGRVADFRYSLLPVFARLLPADAQMAALIQRVRAPYLGKLEQELGVSHELLYRRGNFNGTFDQLILDALMEVRGAEIGFSPGFRWGTSLLPGDALTREQLMNQTAITYPWTTLTDMTGETIKTVLEDVADNLFNPDPYYQQGGDMVRVGGLSYTCEPGAAMGSRIQDMRLAGQPIEAGKRYKVAGWAPVAEAGREAGPPIWDVVETWLKAHPVVARRQLNNPVLRGVEGDPGLP